MAGNAVVWFEIYVQDMDRAKAFYEAVFGVTLERIPTPTDGLEMWSFRGDPAAYGSHGALVKMAGVAPGGGGTLVYFHCADCAVEEARVQPAGGQVRRPKMSIGAYGHISLVEDTEGNLIGLHSMGR